MHHGRNLNEPEPHLHICARTEPHLHGCARTEPHLHGCARTAAKKSCCVCYTNRQASDLPCTAMCTHEKNRSDLSAPPLSQASPGDSISAPHHVFYVTMPPSRVYLGPRTPSHPTPPHPTPERVPRLPPHKVPPSLTRYLPPFPPLLPGDIASTGQDGQERVVQHVLGAGMAVTCHTLTPAATARRAALPGHGCRPSVRAARAISKGCLGWMQAARPSVKAARP